MLSALGDDDDDDDKYGNIISSFCIQLAIIVN